MGGQRRSALPLAAWEKRRLLEGLQRNLPPESSQLSPLRPTKHRFEPKLSAKGRMGLHLGLQKNSANGLLASAFLKQGAVS